MGSSTSILSVFETKRLFLILNNGFNIESVQHCNFIDRMYRNLAMDLILLCRFLVQVPEQSLDYSVQLRK